MDAENANFRDVLDQLINEYGHAIAPVQLPMFENEKFVGYINIIDETAYKYDGNKKTKVDIPAERAKVVADYRNKLVEAAAENDDDLIEKFFNEETLSIEEINRGLKKGVVEGKVAPVFCTVAAASSGISTLLDNIVDLMPSPLQAKPMIAFNSNGDEINIACDEDAPFSAFVFKSVTDNFVGKINLFRIQTGKIKPGDQVFNAEKEKNEKINQVYYMLGKKTYPFEEGFYAGDIGAFAKLQHTSTGDTLRDGSLDYKFAPISFSLPVFMMAVAAAVEGEEDKVFGGINKLMEEDPTFKLEKSGETSDMLIKGMGEMHLDVIMAKIKNKFNVSGKLNNPKIPYRETIKKSSKAQGRHKKQSGGSGQFGDVWIEFEPILDGETEFEFVDKIVGGSVPRNYIPAVDKGLREAIEKGSLAGYPMIRLKATLYDGSSHSVDSNEMAFRMAAKLAYKSGIPNAGAVLLEPIYKYSVVVPDDFMGDVIGDFNRRRGKILGMNPSEDGQVIEAEAPFSEMFKYATDLRSMTQGRGSFTFEFVRYEETPQNVAEKVISVSSKSDDDE